MLIKQEKRAIWNAKDLYIAYHPFDDVYKIDAMHSGIVFVIEKYDSG